MARTPVTLERIRQAGPAVDHAMVAGTTEADIRRHQVEDGEDPDGPLPRPAPLPDVRAIRARLRRRGRRQGRTESSFSEEKEAKRLYLFGISAALLAWVLLSRVIRLVSGKDW